MVMSGVIRHGDEWRYVAFCDGLFSIISILSITLPLLTAAYLYCITHRLAVSLA